MTDELPMTPLTPANCDLRDFPRMMIDIPRLRASAFDATFDDAAWRAGFNLWFSSWHSVPAASLDNDEATLCKAAGLSRDLRTWRKVRAGAMRGWVLCTDGRYYHATVAEFALEAWIEKLQQRLSSGAGNAARWGGTFDPSPVESEILTVIGMLQAIAPDSKAIPKASRRLSRRDPDRRQNTSHRDEKTIPPGSQETGTGKETEKGNKEGKEDGAEAARGSTPAAPQLDLESPDPPPEPFIRIPTNRHFTTGEEVPITEVDVADYERTYPAVDVRQQLRTMRRWSIDNPTQRKTTSGMKKFINSWLSKEQNKARPNGTGTTDGLSKIDRATLRAAENLAAGGFNPRSDDIRF